MKIAIIYKSLSGNTQKIAEAIREALKDDVIYMGEPNETIHADFYFVGSWTDKGMCCAQIEAYLKTLEHKTVFYFGTAGFGGSEEYYQSLFERVKMICPSSNVLTECFFCQGKMPMSVRNRYISMMQEHPDDKKLEVGIKNFDLALSHPNEADVKAAQDWARTVCGKFAMKQD